MRYSFDSFEIDMQLHELRHNGQLCKLEPQEFKVLAYLIECKNVRSGLESCITDLPIPIIERTEGAA